MNTYQFRNLYHLMGFSYEQNAFDQTLTSEFTGEIDEDAFWDGKDQCWIDYDVTKVHVKKTIVLTSWYFDEMTPELKTKFVSLLNRLIEVGHAVYIHQKDGLKKVQGKALLDKELAEFHPVTTKEAVSLAASQGLTVDSLDIINTRRLQDLANYFGGSDYSPSSGYPMARPGGFQYQREQFDPDDRFTVVFNREIEHDKPELLVGELQINGTFHDEDLDRIFAQYPLLDRLVITSSNINAIQLAGLLNHYTSLTSLKIHTCVKLYDHELPALASGTLANLSELSIEDSDLSPFSLNRLLEKAPLLSGFTLRNSLHEYKLELLSDPDSLEKGKLYFSVHSETAAIVFSILNDHREQKAFSISTDDYPGILTMVQSALAEGQSENTMNLILTNIFAAYPYFFIEVSDRLEIVSGYASSFTLSANHFSRLSKMTIDDLMLLPGQIANLTSASPVLESASISCNGNDLMINRSIDSMMPSHTLKEININLNINLQSLITLFSKYPNLSRLDVKKIPRFSRILNEARGMMGSPELEFFKKIKSWSLPPYMKAKDIFQLLKMSPNLVNIDFGSTGSSSVVDELEELPLLSQLTHITVNNSTILASQFQKIINASPQLTSLALYSCYELDFKNLVVEPGQLKHLKELDLSNLTLDASDLARLLLAAPNLERLTISYCFSLDTNVLLIPAECCRQLTYIDIHIPYANLSADFISRLVAASPLLSTLNINSLAISGDKDILFNPDGKYLRHLINFKYGDLLSQTQLINIFDTAPELRQVTIIPDRDGKDSLTLMASKSLRKLDLCMKHADPEMMDTNTFFSQFPALVELHWRNDKLVGDASIPGTLERLVLEEVDINMDSLWNIIQEATLLKDVTLNQCKGVTPEDLLQLQDGFPGIMFHYTSNMSGFALGDSPSNSNMGSRARHTEPRSSLAADGKFEEDRDNILSGKEIFKSRYEFDVPINHYHLKTYQYQPDFQDNLFQITRPDERTLTPVQPVQADPADMYRNFPHNEQVDFFGRKEYQGLTPNVWHQLPGLSNHDELIEFGTRSTQTIEFCRDSNSGYLYFRVQADKPVSIALNFTIKSRPWFSSAVVDLSNDERSEYQQLISELEFNSSGQLSENEAFRRLQARPKDQLTEALRQFCSFSTPFTANFKGPGYAVLNYIIKQRAGACRHRAQLFTALASGFGIKAYYVSNDIHAFTSIINESGQLMSFDLGGAPANTKISRFTEPPELKSTSRRGKSASGSTKKHSDKDLPAGNRFQTWKKHRLQAMDAPHLIEELCAETGRPGRQLLVTPDKQSTDAIHEALVDSDAYNSSFFSPNLDSLSLQCVRIEGGKSTHVDSPLARFLKEAEERGEPVTWFINWSDPKAEHVSFNSIIDNEEPHVNGLSIPPNVRIVAIMDRVSADGMGEEYYSRLDAVSQSPALVKAVIAREPEAEIAENDVLMVNEKDWKKELLGQIFIDGQTLGIHKGGLLNAAAKGEPLSLTIHNAPWSDREFRWFMQEVQKTGRFFYNGDYYRLPEGFQFHFRTPVIHLSSLLTPDQAISSAQESTGNMMVLNRATYALFFPRLNLGEKGVQTSAGLLEANKDREVLLKCSEDMNEVEWYKLLSEAKKHHVRLRFQPTPDVKLPPDLRDRQEEPALLRPGGSVRVIVADDMDDALDAVKTPGTEIIPIGPKSRFDSLFFHVTRNKKGNFVGEETDLLRMIKSGRPIVLKGQFSQALANKLQTLFLEPPSLTINGQRYDVPGPVTIISDDTTLFTATAHETRQYDPESDYQKLPQLYQYMLKRDYRDWNITPCHSHFEGFPHEEGDEIQNKWYQDLRNGLRLSVGKPNDFPVVPSSSSPVEMLDPANPTEPEELLAYLHDKPFVFLVSESGAGKSHFLNHRLRETVPGVKVFNEMNQIEQWAQSKDKMPVLFIDEANISTEHYLAFENLAKGEKAIWLNGKKYELDNHKIVFAGNPERYGGRIQADLFKRYPWYMEFNGQPIGKIIEPFLKHFKDRFLGKLIEHYYREAQKTGLTITPRNAINMCLTAYVLKKQLNTLGLKDQALMHYAIINELKTLSIDKKQTKSLIRDIKSSEVWKSSGESLKESLARLMPELEGSDFEWTPSRIKIGLVLLGMLMVREEKIMENYSPMDTEPDRLKIKQEHGINGFLLEGAPGLGKSRLCIAMLRAMMIEPVIIQLGKPREAREKMLAAFHNGDVVIVDEFNSLADEKLLNDLLSGIDPEKNPPEKQGFCVLATQNPVSFKNRSALSAALENRLMTLILKKYSVRELQTVLRKKYGLDETEIKSLLDERKAAKQYGRRHGFFPLPGTRETFTEAKKLSEKQRDSEALPDTS